MANKTINQIDNTVTSVAGGDYLPIWDTSAGKTGKITRENLVKGLQSSLTFDNYPTKNSSNPAKSGGIFSANAVIMASSKTITSAPTISSGSIIRVMFTSAITGSDTTTALPLSYNGTSYPVKVGKQGSLSNFVASNVNNAYIYLQAYTTLELAFDGTQFIIIGNPVVLSSSDYTIYADGKFVNSTVNKTIPISDVLTPVSGVTLEDESEAVKNGNLLSLYIEFTTNNALVKNDPLFNLNPTYRPCLKYLEATIYEHSPDTFSGYIRVQKNVSNIVLNDTNLSAGTYRITTIFLVE